MENLSDLRGQSEIDALLDRQYVFNVEVSGAAPLPNSNHFYEPLLDLVGSGFPVRLRELLHAVGSKVAVLPQSEEDECLKVSYALLASLDLTHRNLSFRADIPTDFQTPRSQELGVGITCLVAAWVFRIPWDALGPIPGLGKRFDYRGHNNGVDAIFESKGTKYRAKQPGQIRDGVEKKTQHHQRGDHYDIELIVSTYVGVSGDPPRILLGDPPEVRREWLMSPQGDKYFRMQHYARVAQFIGAPGLARLLYLDAEHLRTLGMDRYDDRAYSRVEFPKNRVRIAGEEYLGTFYWSHLPKRGDRYTHLRGRNLRAEPIDDRLAVFQGLREDRLRQLQRGGAASAESVVSARLEVVRETENGERASIFPDGSCFFACLRDQN